MTQLNGGFFISLLKLIIANEDKDLNNYKYGFSKYLYISGIISFVKLTLNLLSFSEMVDGII